MSRHECLLHEWRWDHALLAWVCVRCPAHRAGEAR